MSIQPFIDAKNKWRLLCKGILDYSIPNTCVCVFVFSVGIRASLTVLRQFVVNKNYVYW